MKRRAFTLIELLVVVAIIALLIAILLPSLGRARDTAKTVRCASNLKQLYTGINLYAATNDDTFLPAVVTNSTGSFNSELWAGYDQLGPMFGTASTGNGAGGSGPVSQVTVVTQIQKLLDCPCVDHYAAWGGVFNLAVAGPPWWADYTYNQNLGYNGQANGIYKMNTIKRVDVPRTALVSIDDREKNGNHDYVYSKTANLVPPVNVTGGTIANANGVPGDSIGEAGVVHKMQTQTNMLFGDGQIITDNINKIQIDGSTDWVINFREPTGSQFPFQ